MTTKQDARAVVAAAGTAALLAAISTIAPSSSIHVGSRSYQANQTTTATITPPEGISPIYDSQTAIALSLQRFPPGRNPAADAARLISTHDLLIWTGEATAQLDPGDPTWQMWSPSHPVWLVGIIADGLVVRDIIRPGGELLDDVSSVQGGFYAWDASSGFLIMEGALIENGRVTFESILGLTNQTMDIHPATALPTLPPETAESPPTQSDDEIATIIAEATIEAMTPSPTP